MSILLTFYFWYAEEAFQLDIGIVFQLVCPAAFFDSVEDLVKLLLNVLFMLVEAEYHMVRSEEAYLINAEKVECGRALCRSDDLR